MLKSQLKFLVKHASTNRNLTVRSILFLFYFSKCNFKSFDFNQSNRFCGWRPKSTTLTLLKCYSRFNLHHFKQVTPLRLMNSLLRHEGSIKKYWTNSKHLNTDVHVFSTISQLNNCINFLKKHFIYNVIILCVNCF